MIVCVHPARAVISIHVQVLKGQLDFKSDPWPKISDAAKDCVKRLLEMDPSKRATSEQVRHGCSLYQFTTLLAWSCRAHDAPRDRDLLFKGSAIHHPQCLQPRHSLLMLCEAHVAARPPKQKDLSAACPRLFWLSGTNTYVHFSESMSGRTSYTRCSHVNTHPTRQILKHEWLVKEGVAYDISLDSVVLKRMKQFAQVNQQALRCKTGPMHSHVCSCCRGMQALRCCVDTAVKPILSQHVTSCVDLSARDQQLTADKAKAKFNPPICCAGPDGVAADEQAQENGPHGCWAEPQHRRVARCGHLWAQDSLNSAPSR